jgi:hypothetical protein
MLEGGSRAKELPTVGGKCGEGVGAHLPGLQPNVSYLLCHGVGHLIVPLLELLEAYLVVRLMQLAASKVGEAQYVWRVTQSSSRQQVRSVC